MRNIIIMFLTVVLSSPVLAGYADEWGKVIVGVGVYLSGNQGYITFLTNTELDCQYGKNVYWDIRTETGMAAYSTALMAKVSNKKVRVIYNLMTPGEPCQLDLIYVE